MTEENKTETESSAVPEAQTERDHSESVAVENENSGTDELVAAQDLASVEEEALVEEVVEAPPLPSVGQRLREAREAAGLSVSDVAERFKLGVAQVEAVESDAWEKLPGRTFARGVVRGYAREMRLDAEALVAEVLPEIKVVEAPIVPASTPSKSAPSIQSGPKRDLAVAVFGGVLLIVAILVYFLWPEETKQEVVLAPSAATVETPVPAAPSGSGESSQLLPPTVVTLNTSPTVPAAAPAADVAQSPVIKISFTGTSWVEVKDKTGNPILSLTGNAGLEKEVTGQPPFAIHIGNVGGVKMQYKGQAVDLQPFTTNNIGRVKLD